MKKNYYAKALALTVAASMVSVPAFAEENGTETAALQADAEGETAETENKAVTLPLLDEEKPVAVAEAEEEEPTETPAETTTHGTTENEPVALEEEGESQTVATVVDGKITEAGQIYALAKILNGTATLEDYKIFGYDAVSTANKEALRTAAYTLENDITLTDNDNNFRGIPNFKGTFDGQNHTIHVDFDWTADLVGSDNFGCLFASVTDGTVENVNFDGTLNITAEVRANGNYGHQKIAVVAGQTNTDKNGANTGTTLKNITSDVDVNLNITSESTVPFVYFGAMTASFSGGKDKLVNCVNTGDITPVFPGVSPDGNSNSIGGLVGRAYAGATFENCKNSGTVDARESTAKVNASGMAAEDNNNKFINCELSGDVFGKERTVKAFAKMSEDSTGNVMIATVTGKAGETIAYTGDAEQTVTLESDGTAEFRIPVKNENGSIENNAFSYTQYLTVDGKRLDWYNLDSTELRLTLNSADAGDLIVPFQTESTALVIEDKDTLLNIQKAINEGDYAAIDALYALGGTKVAEDGYSEARAALQTAYYKLGDDITITDAAYTGIGVSVNPFSGHFDGQGHTVTLQRSSSADAVTTGFYGLFGSVETGASGDPVIENVNVVIDADVVAGGRTTKVGVLAGGLGAGELKGIKTTVKKLNVTGAVTIHVGGLCASAYPTDIQNVSVEIEGPLTVNNTGANKETRLGGALGVGSLQDPVTVTFKDGAALTAEGADVCVGGFTGYNSVRQFNLYGSKLINESETPMNIKGIGTSNVRVGGWIGMLTDSTAAADNWVRIDGTTKMEGNFTVEAEYRNSTPGDDVASAGGVIGYFNQSYSVSIEDYVNKATVKGTGTGAEKVAVGGLVGNANSSTGKELVIENSANAGELNGNTIVGGLVGKKNGNLTLTCNNALYLKDDTKVTKGIGNFNTDATGIVAFETAKVADGTFGTPIADVLTANAPAALTIDGNAEFNGANLIYTATGEQTLKFLWNGEEIHTAKVNVAQKDLTNDSNVTITGVNNKYTNDDAAKAAMDNIKVVYDGKVLEEDTDYTVEQDTTNHQFKITFKGNYTGNATQDYTVAPDALAVDVKDYVGNYDGEAHGIAVKNATEGVTMKYGTSAGTYNEDSVTRTNAGTTVVYWEATKDGQTVTGTALIQINKAPVMLTADRTSMRGAGTVTLTVNGVVESELGSVIVVSDDVDVSGNDGVYTAYLPNATKTYTFAVKVNEVPPTRNAFDRNNYEWDDTSCTVNVTRKKSSSSSDTSAPTYGVSTGKTENGTISVTPAKAEAGETVTIKATPDSGYQLDKVTVKDKDNSNVKLTKVNDNEYTFTMPSGKVSVDATFVQKDAADDNQNNVGETSKVIKLQIGSRIVTVDNEAVIYDVAPVIRNDRTLVPIRIVTETLGGKVDWNGVTKEVTLTIDGKEIKMTVGKTLEKYGVAPVIIDGRTFVPVRFVADELGATVAWDDATKTVTITKIEK